MRNILLIILLSLLVGCATVTPTQVPTSSPQPPTETSVPTVTMTQTVTALPTPTETPTPTATPSYPLAGLGPRDFPLNVNPLTGLELDDPSLLDRRPIIIKVENLPRDHRPQYGLSLADLVFEYYTELGATRFAAIYYGTDAEQVGPIRSARFFDDNLIQMYKGIFVFGSAYQRVIDRLFNAVYANRLVLETNNSCPALCRFEPNKSNFLMANTVEMGEYLVSRQVNNSRQNLDGMFFKLEAPGGGQPAEQVFVRYSGAIYNRWDFDLASGKYLRFVDLQDDVNRNNPVYVQHTDQLTGKPIAVDSVVVIFAPHSYYDRTEEMEVLDIMLSPSSNAYFASDGASYQGGSGPAYLARDGQMYAVRWFRPTEDSVLTLVGPDGQPFPYKPGQTWIEVIGASSKVEQSAEAWKFTFVITP